MRGYGGKERGREGGSEECTLILPPYPFCKGVATETNIAAVMAAIYSGGEQRYGISNQPSLQTCSKHGCNVFLLTCVLTNNFSYSPSDIAFLKNKLDSIEQASASTILMALAATK